MVEIHNGEVFGEELPAVAAPAAPPKPNSLPPDLDPDLIAAAMAQVVSNGLARKALPMEIVNELLQLKSPNGGKVVWTRFDVFQLFGIWSKKLTGEARL